MPCVRRNGTCVNNHFYGHVGKRSYATGSLALGVTVPDLLHHGVYARPESMAADTSVNIGRTNVISMFLMFYSTPCQPRWRKSCIANHVIV